MTCYHDDDDDIIARTILLQFTNGISSNRCFQIVTNSPVIHSLLNYISRMFRLLYVPDIKPRVQNLTI